MKSYNYSLYYIRLSRGRIRMVIGFITTYASNSHHH